MIYAPLSEMRRYEAVHPLMAKAIAALESFAKNPPENGRNEIEGDLLFANVQTYSPKPERGLFEAHRKYIDLQLLVSGGPEVHTFFPDDGKETVKDDRLDTPKDILFYENRPETAGIEGRVVLEPGAYAIYFPWDIHVPGQCDDDGPKAYRKIVLKVPVAACL
jgi:YhcH/YjgK/YiaL family protein